MKSRPQSPTRFDDLRQAIARAHPTLSKQLQRIARYALEKPHDLALGTVATVAGACGVHPSAMIRFANALGYRGFSDMQQVFRTHLVARSASYRERIELLRRESGDGATPTGVLHEFVSQAIAELGHLEESIHAADVKAAVRLLAGASSVYTLAQRRAFPIAGYVAYALSQLELHAHLLDGVGGMLGESVRAIGRDDVLLVASFRNYSPDVIDAANACHARGVPVIAITDSPLSPLRPAAKICFEIGDDSDKPFRSLVGPLCLAQALVVSTGYALSEAGARSSPPSRGRARSGAGAAS